MRQKAITRSEDRILLHDVETRSSFSQPTARALCPTGIGFGTGTAEA